MRTLINLACVALLLTGAMTVAAADTGKSPDEKTLNRFHSGIFLEANAKVNLRTEPSTGSVVIRKLDKREVAVVVHPSPSHQYFVRVVTHDGKVGWAHKDYLQLWDTRLAEMGYLATTSFDVPTTITPLINDGQKTN